MTTNNDKNQQEEEVIQLPSLVDFYFFSKLINNDNPPIKKRKLNVKKEKGNLIKIEKKDENSKRNTLDIDNNKEIIKKSKEIMEFNDEELNNLKYDLALKFDKRKYCEYYFSLLKTKHVLIFSFFYGTDYNVRIIKMDLFFISFVIYYTINALFFNDNTMHKIYEDQGSYNIIYQLPQIAYSSLVSTALDILLKLLALSEGNILEFKKDKEKTNLDKREKSLNSKLSIKFIIFFIISTIFLLLFWYYLSMFGAIYRNTQLHLIKDTLISFGLSLLYPFGIYLIPGIFRILSLSNNKNKRKCLYNVSLLFQFF